MSGLPGPIGKQITGGVQPTNVFVQSLYSNFNFNINPTSSVSSGNIPVADFSTKTAWFLVDSGSTKAGFSISGSANGTNFFLIHSGSIGQVNVLTGSTIQHALRFLNITLVNDNSGRLSGSMFLTSY